MSTTYRIEIESESDPSGTLDRSSAFGDHETWFASRVEADRVAQELSETGDWPSGQQVKYRVVEYDGPAWEWGTGFANDDLVGAPSGLFELEESARTAADEAGYGDHAFLIVRPVAERCECGRVATLRQPLGWRRKENMPAWVPVCDRHYSELTE